MRSASLNKPNTDPSDPAECWWLWRDVAHPAAWNMACDAALLEGAARLPAPVLRLYGWTEPAATFGYSQSYQAVAVMTLLRPLVRRPTGGGMVPHDADWTYSLIVPVAHAWYALTARESYERMHAWMRDAFAALAVETVLAPCAVPKQPGQCFAGPERHDLLHQGRKVAGAAQRRTRAGLLIQGSVQPGSTQVARRDWEDAVAAVAGEWGVAWRAWESDSDFSERVSRLADEVYGNPAHNRRR